ncbi:MAG TPA: SIS domain-containing protein [Acidimicrobiales bacterium]|nr:SIS domain-containing protein [Acidimicrobiales bacterium]
MARPPRRDAPSAPGIAAQLSQSRQVLEQMAAAALADPNSWPGALEDVARSLSAVDDSLKGAPGLATLLSRGELPLCVAAEVEAMSALVRRLEALLDSGASGIADGPILEGLNVNLVVVRDRLWALSGDRLEAARQVSQMCGLLGFSPAEMTPGPLSVLWSVHVALRSLDRLEVRGRDSAGLHLMVWDHGLDPQDQATRALLASRRPGPEFKSMSAVMVGGCLSLVYKVAAEIGELGDNVAGLRQALSSDVLLARALRSQAVAATVVGHTRWASVGLISEPNAHPLNSDETGTAVRPYVIGALNGDIDNHAALVTSEHLSIAPGVTTDAKLIPVMVSRVMGEGADDVGAFRRAVARFEGSVGIVANTATNPGRLLLALRGSGQSLNIGIADDAYIVASEAYGLVEETSTYLRMDGDNGGQVVVCERSAAGDIEGLRRSTYAGDALPVVPGDAATAEVTTRDVDRQGFRHYLLKEISEAPASVRKTLRGRVVVCDDGTVQPTLGDEVIPPSLREALAQGRLRSVLVIGQGTAAVAGRSVAMAIARALPNMAVRALTATELSGWGPTGTGLPDEMSTTLVVAISQSGTTTDTNRTVDLVRARGATVVSIVNRRSSDLVQKSHGVLYTSDGRDVEMSVASTKAFYSQVTAGFVLAGALAFAAPVSGEADRRWSCEVLAALRELPAAMDVVLAKRSEIAAAAATLAPARRSWAVVGSGPDQVAAAEIRIKLSELCYKAIALDGIEDKKHIDLSAEPLIIVCASAPTGANARDVAKEIEIFKAHKAAPFAIVSEDQRQFLPAGVDHFVVPASHPQLGFVLAAMVGHLFGYEAALAIDAQARPLREARALLEPGAALEEVMAALQAVTAPVLAGFRAGQYDGHLNASTAVRLISLLRYATGALPVEGYEAEMGKAGTPAAISADLIAALGTAIDELTRPIDAIKHQAKTVTVGVSRSEEELTSSPLVAEVVSGGAPLSSLGYRSLRSLAALAPSVEEVLGYTRYQVDMGPPATIAVMATGGIADHLRSRTVSDPALRGTKHRAAEKREVTVFKGAHDGRTGIMVPEVKDGQVVALTLLHTRFASYLPAATARSVLEAYQSRYQALVDAVTELQPRFDDAVLATVPLIELLTEPVAVLAAHWAAQQAL